MTKIRDRERDLKRQGPTRQPKHRILIVCEGKKTEPRYFRELQHHFQNRLVHVEVNDQSGVPLTLVERARSLRAKSLRKTAESTGQHERNPSTNMDELTEQIRLGGRR